MYGTSPIGVLPYGAAPAYVAPAAASERVTILSPRDIDLATVTASTVVSSLPAANLQNQEPSKVWRSTSAIDQHIDITLAEPKACNAVAMAAFNMSGAGVWRLKGYASSSDFGGATILDSGWASVWPGGFRHGAPAWGHEVALLRVDNDVAIQHWRLELSDPAEAVTYLDIGRLALGRAVQFSINMDIEAGLGFVPNDVQEPNGYGQIFTDPRPYAQRQFDMPWSALGQQESHDAAMELARLRGQAGDIFCFLDPGEVTNFHRWSMQGIFTGRADFRSRPLWVTDSDGTARQAWGFNFNLIQKL